MLEFIVALVILVAFVAIKERSAYREPVVD